MKRKIYLIPSIVLILLGFLQLFFIYCSLYPVTDVTYLDEYIQSHWMAYTVLGIISIILGVLGLILKYKIVPIQLIVFIIFIYSQYILPPSVCAP